MHSTDHPDPGPSPTLALNDIDCDRCGKPWRAGHPCPPKPVAR